MLLDTFQPRDRIWCCLLAPFPFPVVPPVGLIEYFPAMLALHAWPGSMLRNQQEAKPSSQPIPSSEKTVGAIPVVVHSHLFDSLAPVSFFARCQLVAHEKRLILRTGHLFH